MLEHSTDPEKAQRRPYRPREGPRVQRRRPLRALWRWGVVRVSSQENDEVWVEAEIRDGLRRV